MGWTDTSMRLPDLNCPYCGAGISATLGSDENRIKVPTNGAVSLCFSCATPSVFVVTDMLEIGLRKPTPEERASIMTQIGDVIQELVEFNVDRRRR